MKTLEKKGNAARFAGPKADKFVQITVLWGRFSKKTGRAERKMRAIFILMSAALMSAGMAVAEDAPAFREFTFKRVKPPSSGSKKKINIQITEEDLERQRGKSTSLVARPVEPSETPTGDATQPVPRQKTGSYAWFWEKVSPNIAESGPGRLLPALIVVGNGPGGKAVGSPRLDTLRTIVEARGVDILKASIGTDVSPALALAVIAVESGGRADAISSAGAQGLMQLMPATAERFGVADALNGADNIKGGIAYLDLLLKEFKGDPILALASYNAGENAVKRAGGVPDYAETRDYVPKVLAAFKTARGLCLTPPELASDGCVFNLKMAKAGE